MKKILDCSTAVSIGVASVLTVLIFFGGKLTPGEIKAFPLAFIVLVAISVIELTISTFKKQASSHRVLCELNTNLWASLGNGPLQALSHPSSSR